MKFTFIDKEQLCVYKDGKTEKYESAYIARYRENLKREQKNREWKKNSDVMMYDGFYVDGNGRVDAEICALSLTVEENKLLYVFSVNETSGIYYKYLDDEKKTEAHFITSNEESFGNIVVHQDGRIAGTVRKDLYTSDIAVFSPLGGDYKSVTSGDSKDENPFFGREGEIWFNSYGVGRNMENEFIRYMPSEILKINVRNMELKTELSDPRYSYIKPILDGDENLYCIRKPGEEREKRNFFLEILLIPVRIVQAIVGFISMFVTIFAGKPLVEGKGKTRSGNGAAKHADERKIFIHNHLLNVEEELKKNKKSEDHGFIPLSWKLVKISKSENGYEAEKAEELASGVADFCFAEENTIVYTNGKHIFALNTGSGEKRKKLVNVDFCVKLGALQSGSFSEGSAQDEDFFDGV